MELGIISDDEKISLKLIRVLLVFLGLFHIMYGNLEFDEAQFIQ